MPVLEYFAQPRITLKKRLRTSTKLLPVYEKYANDHKAPDSGICKAYLKEKGKRIQLTPLDGWLGKLDMDRKDTLAGEVPDTSNQYFLCYMGEGHYHAGRRKSGDIRGETLPPWVEVVKPALKQRYLHPTMPKVRIRTRTRARTRVPQICGTQIRPATA